MEIVNNAERLQSICGRPVETIAYPHGKYNETTLEIVKEIRLKAAFTTSEKIVSNLTDPFQIGRFQVRNWNGSEFSEQLLKWKRSFYYL